MTVDPRNHVSDSEKPESVQVTVHPSDSGEAGVCVVTIKIDNHEPSSSVVRTSPRELALQD
jgi:hypothetical protein